MTIDAKCYNASYITSVVIELDLTNVYTFYIRS